MLVRGGRLVSRRTCIELTWAKLIPGKDKIQEGPRGLPASMPKFPHGASDKDRLNRERPYHNLKDYEEWEVKFRAWLEANPGEVVDGGGKPYEPKPYECFEAFESYKLKLLEMSDEEKALLGHTTNAERARPAHEVFGKQYAELKEPSVVLRRAGRALDHPPRGVTGNNGYLGSFINGKQVGELQGDAAGYDGKAPDYMQELRDAIAARKAPKEEAETEKLSS